MEELSPKVARMVTPEAIANRVATRRANLSIKQAALDAFDILGNVAFFVQLGRGSAEDKRCVANIFAKLIPLEVAGTLDHSLTVRVVTQLGEDVINVTRPNNLPKRPVTVDAIPVSESPGRASEEDHAHAADYDPQRV